MAKELIILEDSILYDVDAFDVARYMQKIRRLEQALAEKASKKTAPEKRLIRLASIPPLGTIIPPVKVRLPHKKKILTISTSFKNKGTPASSPVGIVAPESTSQVSPSRLKPKMSADKSAQSTKKQAIKIVVPPLTLPQIQENPLRVLGLPAGAKHEELHQRAEQLYRAIRLGIETENPWSLEWMGTISLKKEDIRNAVGMLSNPRLRLEARIFWLSSAFSQPNLIKPAPLQQVQQYTPLKTLVDQMASYSNPAYYSHDAALLALLDCHAQDNDFKNPQKWVEAIALWHRVLNSTKFWADMLLTEMTSGFDPIACEEDFEAVSNIVFQRFMESILRKTNKLLADDRDAQVKAFLRELQKASLEEWEKEYIETGILGDLEAQYKTICDETTGESYGNNAILKFEVEIEPLLNRLINLYEFNSAKTEELQELAAYTTLGIISKYNWSNPKESCATVIRAAKKLASPKSLNIQRLKLLEKQWQKGRN
jgi:hypothetical protein